MRSGVNDMSQPVQRISGEMVGEVVTCRDESDREVTIGGDSRPRATDVLLMALAGCATATLNALLQRDGFKPSKIEVTVEGVRSEDRPRRFAEVNVIFVIDCPGVTPELMDKYVVATERACPVAQSLIAERKFEYRIAHG